MRLAEIAGLDPICIARPIQPACRAVVVVPAKDEETTLPRMLNALRLQRDAADCSLDPSSYEVILLLNNCSDQSAEVAEQYQQHHTDFVLHVVSCTITARHAFVGTARRMLMDAAYHRLQSRDALDLCAILSTDADTVVAPDWIAANLRAIEAGADAVGGVIHLLPDDLDTLLREREAVYDAYQLDRRLQRLIARLESILDPEPADPWPRHMEHFGASIACTPTIYAACGGLPPVRHLEDVAFVDALRRVQAKIRHCPDTHVFTSARFDGRAEIGLSDQLRRWCLDAEMGVEQWGDSAAWLAHRFGCMAALRKLHVCAATSSLSEYPVLWRGRLARLLAEQHSTARFLQLLDCDSLIEEMFVSTGCSRTASVKKTIAQLEQVITSFVPRSAKLRMKADAETCNGAESLRLELPKRSARVR